MPPRLALASILLALLAACGAGSDELSFPERELREPDPATVGRVSGRMIWSGDVPPVRRVRMTSDCRHHPDGAPLEDFVVRDGGLDNVFVYVKSGLDAWVFPIPREPVVIDQRGCLYVPHVVGVQRWQPVEFRNGDDTGHNVNTSSARHNEPFNFSQSANGAPRTKQFTENELMLEARCNIHGWMKCLINVVDHPCFAVSADGGRWSISGLPPGSYVIEAVHERLGRQEQSIDVTASGEARLDFTWTK